MALIGKDWKISTYKSLPSDLVAQQPILYIINKLGNYVTNNENINVLIIISHQYRSHALSII